MTDEKKTMRGGLTPEQKDAALSDDALEEASGGYTALGWADKATAELAQIVANNDKEQ